MQSIFKATESDAYDYLHSRGKVVYLHTSHHKDGGDHGVEVGTADGASSVDHDRQQHLHSEQHCTLDEALQRSAHQATCVACIQYGDEPA